MPKPPKEQPTRHVSKAQSQGVGLLAQSIGKTLPIEILESAAGFYIGTQTEEGFPCSRESREYWRNRARAEAALAEGTWTQRPNPYARGT